MDYMKLNGMASKLIKQMGIPVTVTRANGSSVGSAHGVFTASEAKLSDTAMPGSPVVEINKSMLVTASSQAFKPRPGDVVISGTSSWTVDTAEEIKPASTVIVWKLGVK
jgi:hypothetical protein